MTHYTTSQFLFAYVAPTQKLSTYDYRESIGFFHIPKWMVFERVNFSKNKCTGGALEICSLTKRGLIGCRVDLTRR
jgi:hypothetical protein